MTDKDLISQVILSALLFMLLIKFDFAFMIETAAIAYFCFIGEKALEQILDHTFGGER